MGSPSGGVGGSSGAGSSGGAGGSDNDRGGPSGSDNDRGGASGSDNDRGSSSTSDRGSNGGRSDASPPDSGGGDDRAESSQRGMTGSERAGSSFDDAMSNAAGDTFGGLSNPSNTDTDRAAGPPGIGAPPSSTSESHPANEFSGLGPSGGPIDNGPSSNDSRNSQRGYGPDDSLAGGIDQDVNQGLAPDENGRQPAAPDPSSSPKTDAYDLVGPAGYGAAGLQGGLEAYRDYVDRGARSAAAGTLTNGNAGSLPADGYANRTDLARTIADPTMTTGKALDATPYGPNAKSTQQLSAGARTASTFNRFANGAGLAVQPGAGAIQGFMNTPEDASWTETVTNTVVGAVKEFDDTGLSYGAGFVVGAGTVAVSPFTGPAAPVVAGSAPATATAAAVGTGLAYDNSSIDQAIDGFIEDYGRPGLLGTLNAVDNYVVDPLSDFFDRTFGDDDSSN